MAENNTTNQAESDAQVLWDDVVELLGEEGTAPALLAML